MPLPGCHICQAPAVRVTGPKRKRSAPLCNNDVTDTVNDDNDNDEGDELSMPLPQTCLPVRI